MVDDMFAARDAKRKAAAEAQAAAEARSALVLRTKRAIEIASFGTWTRHGRDSRFNDRPEIEHVGIVGERITISPEAWGARIHEAAQAWRVVPGFGVLITHPCGDLKPEVTGVGVWSAAEAFWRASKPAATVAAVVDDVRKALERLGPSPTDRDHADTDLGFWNYFRQLDQDFGHWMNGAQTPYVDPQARDHVHAALLIARGGNAGPATAREALRQGLAVLGNPGDHAGAYYGDASALVAAAIALEAAAADAAARECPPIAAPAAAVGLEAGEVLRRAADADLMCVDSLIHDLCAAGRDGNWAHARQLVGEAHRLRGDRSDLTGGDLMELRPDNSAGLPNAKAVATARGFIAEVVDQLRGSRRLMTPPAPAVIASAQTGPSTPTPRAGPASADPDSKRPLRTPRHEAPPDAGDIVKANYEALRGLSASIEAFLKLLGHPPRSFTDSSQRNKRGQWARSVRENLTPTHRGGRGVGHLYFAVDLLHTFANEMWQPRQPVRKELLNTHTQAFDAEVPGFVRVLDP